MQSPDNTAARDFSIEEMHQSRAKHLEIKFTFIRELILKRVMKVMYIKTDEQLADVFTKSMDKVAFLRHLTNLLKEDEEEGPKQGHGGVLEQITPRQG